MGKIGTFFAGTAVSVLLAFAALQIHQVKTWVAGGLGFVLPFGPGPGSPIRVSGGSMHLNRKVPWSSSTTSTLVAKNVDISTFGVETFTAKGNRIIVVYPNQTTGWSIKETSGDDTSEHGLRITASQDIAIGIDTVKFEVLNQADDKFTPDPVAGSPYRYRYVNQNRGKQCHDAASGDEKCERPSQFVVTIGPQVDTWPCGDSTGHCHVYIGNE